MKIDTKEIDIFKLAENYYNERVRLGYGFFDSSEDYKKCIYENISKKNKAWTKSKKCIFQGCKKTSIKKSHSVQKASSLRNIAIENMVYRPWFDEFKDTYIFKEEKISDCTTFPGFCEEHEKLFSVFENKCKIELEEEALLQAYRTVCREIVYIEHQQDWMKKFIKDQERKLTNDFANYCKKQGYCVSFKNVKSVKFIHHDIIYALNNAQIRRLDDKLADLRLIHDGLISYVKNKSVDNIVIYSLVIDYKFPICLSGIANANLKNEETGIKDSVISCLNVLPYNNETVIFLCGLKKHEEGFNKILETYWSHYTQNELMILNLIENYMIHGSDNWFVSKGEWDKISEVKKEFLISEILDFNKSFIDECKYSIFDDIRKTLLEQFENQNSNESIDKLIKKERNKLNYNIDIEKVKHNKEKYINRNLEKLIDKYK